MAVILNLGLYEATAPRGALLAFVFCLGLGIPFVLAGLAYRRMLVTFTFFRRHQVALMRIAGSLMALVGLLLATGMWDGLLSILQSALITDFSPGI